VVKVICSEFFENYVVLFLPHYVLFSEACDPTFSFGSCLRWMGALKEKAAQIRKRLPPCSAGG